MAASKRGGIYRGMSTWLYHTSCPRKRPSRPSSRRHGELELRNCLTPTGDAYIPRGLNDGVGNGETGWEGGYIAHHAAGTSCFPQRNLRSWCRASGEDHAMRRAKSGSLLRVSAKDILHESRPERERTYHVLAERLGSLPGCTQQHIQLRSQAGLSSCVLSR